MDRKFRQVQTQQQLLDRLGSHPQHEIVGAPFAVLRSSQPSFFFGQDLAATQRSVTRVDDHVVLKIDHLLETRGLHVQQSTQTTRHALEEPDVHNRCRQLDVTHPLATDTTVSHLHAATVADHPLVLHPAVLAASTLPVLLRTENPLAEQSVPLGLVRAVVDRLGLLDLAK